MWRYAKRSLLRAVSSVGRGGAASTSSRPSSVSARVGAGERAAARAHRKREIHAQSLLELRQTWEIEHFASKLRAANGDSAARTAVDLMRAMRGAGVPWLSVASNPAVREEVRVAALQAMGAAVVAAPAWNAASSVAAASLRRLMPTMALRHAGGSWRDALTHPAFRVEVPHMIAAFRVRSGLPSASSASSASSAAAKAVAGQTSPPPAAMLISSSIALRHAGCSWLDVARHAAFHACVKSRVVGAAGYAYANTFVRHPFTSALITSVTKCVGSDLLVQKIVEGREEIDWRRAACFFALGLSYVGAFQYGLYNRVMKPMGGFLTARYGAGASVSAMVFVDSFLVSPFVYLPTFFGLKAWANGECAATEVPARARDVFSGTATSFLRSRESSGGDGDDDDDDGASPGGATSSTLCYMMWAYWMPAQAINFWLVPRHLTIPFMNVLGFGWNAIMSATNGASEAAGETAATRAAAMNDAERRAATTAAVVERLIAARVGEEVARDVADVDAGECAADEGCARALARSVARGDALALST